MSEDIGRDIKDDDLLGRAIFSSNRAKKAMKGNVDFRDFFKRGSNKISVDRFGFCSDETLTDIQDKNAVVRSKKDKKRRSFYGWLKMTVNVARGIKKTRMVKASPEVGKNPYHADIILPDNVRDDDERRQHAKELSSDKSIKWVSRYEGTQ